MITITVLDDLHPEDGAMLQALYSRSPASVQTHLERVKKSGSGNFMNQFYVGYGHASIGDCGSTTIFVENISMLAAKAIQDWPLYSGQESSTRYIDFSKQEILDPVNKNEIQNSWIDFYHKASAPLLEHLSTRYPRKEGEEEKQYERALKARSFDVLRGFLPAGATTNVAWHTNLRQAADKLSWMRQHPLNEVSSIAEQIWTALLTKYPNSFRDDRPEIAAWKESTAEDFTYNTTTTTLMDSDQLLMDWDFLHFPRMTAPKSLVKAMESRPRGAVLPHQLGRYGNIESKFLLDFGSFRDLQRHRNGYILMPLLSTDNGFHPWYLEQLPEDLRLEAEALISKQTELIRQIEEPNIAQYYVAMGFMVFIQMTQSLPAFVYFIELRTNKTVHPTLRSICQKQAIRYKKRYPEHALHVDLDPDDWDVRRGKQTILEK